LNSFFQENNGDDRETETSWIYDDLNKSEESMNMDSSSVAVEDVESRRRLRKSLHETVKEAELEDFFQVAEKDLRNKLLECSMKYNFDFEKDEPLGGGRYEWVKLNP
jgi:hypothetical protein